MALLLSVIGVAYALGSIPFGYIVGRLRGVDVRKHGSGNIGATNVLRVLGKPWGISVFLADALKGFLAVRLAIMMVNARPELQLNSDFYAILAAAACVMGHSFPVWLKFKGGKGVATSGGALLGVIPIATICVFLVWLAVFFSTRYVSLASILASLSLPIFVALMKGANVVFYFSLAMTALVVWRHRSNISRLRAGTESRFNRS